MSTKVDTYQQPSESVRGGAVSECGVSAAWARGMPRAGWAGCPAPPILRKPAVAVEVAGQRPALPRVQGCKPCRTSP
ncbi:hypothetical protein D7Y24_03490 [Stenotrophomonas maltophilia]|nr:hypothetical protein [Stenotrophomonas maltophilia]